MQKSKAERQLKDIQYALVKLVFDAERVSNKYGRNDNDELLDWEEWVSLRRSILEAKYFFPE